MSILSLIWVKIATIATGVLITVGAVNPLSTEQISTSTSFTVTDQVAYFVPIEKPQTITIQIATTTPVSQETPQVVVPPVVSQPVIQEVAAPQVQQPIVEAIKPSCTLKASVIEYDRVGDPYTAKLEWEITGDTGPGKFEYARTYGGDEMYEIDGVPYALGFEPLKFPSSSLITTATTSRAAYKGFYKISFNNGVYCVAKTK